ncbi:MAG: hypothetical protein ACRDGV_00845 [Candidatus Limnocylindria bacterium]
MKVVAVVRDLMLFSRIEAAARQAGAELSRVDSPQQLPPPAQADVVLVDWNERAAGWEDALRTWRSSAPGTRLVLFGPHTDLQAHADAKRHGLGPMWARSRLVRELPALVRGPA